MACIQLESGSISSVMTSELNSLINNTNKLSGEIDNAGASDLDLFDDVLLHTAVFSSPPDTDAICELYLLESLDGTTFVDGTDTIDPAFSNLGGVFNIREVTAAQDHIIRGINLPPSKF